MDVQGVLDQVHAATVGEAARGVVTKAIPALSEVDGSRFGIAFVDIGGRRFGAGDWEEPFSIQSVSKVFSLALVLAHDGEALWTRVRRHPSVSRFNSLSELDGDGGIPRNPFVNAGALVVADRLLEIAGDGRQAVLDLVRSESGSAAPAFDPVVAGDELAHCHRNAAIAHLIADHGNLRHDVDTVLTHYTWQCSIAATCGDVAAAGLFLARGGGGVLSPSATKRLNATLLTCGTYDAAGDFAYSVGLPAKSGVGGGILAVLPGRGTLCVWGPALDPHGNSAAGTAALGEFTTLTGWSIF